jgi:hypothetical protein
MLGESNQVQDCWYQYHYMLPYSLVYSICLLDQCDFEGIGRQMPKGTGVDCLMADGTKARKRERIFFWNLEVPPKKQSQ